MVLIAFCAIALVANVTNAQPVGGNNRRGRKREVGREEGGEGGTRRKKTKQKQKQDKRFGQLVMNPKKTHYSTENGNSQAHRITLTG